VRALLLLLASCAGSLTPVGDDEPIDEAAVASVLPGFHESPAFVAVNRAMYPSALDGTLIDVYVSANAFAEFGSITPETSASKIVVPEGTYIIRALPDKLTLMVKGPPGYNPELGDYWFGVATPDGTLVKSGKLSECYGCHLDRANDSYLFGVPADMR